MTSTQPIGTLLKTAKGKKPKVLEETSRQGLIPYIDISALEHGTKRQFADPRDSKVVRAGSLVMVWDGARSGWVGIAPFDGALGSTLMELDSPLDKRFLAAFLRSHFDDINSNPRGTGIPHVNPDILNAFEISVMANGHQQAVAQLTEEVAGWAHSSQRHLAKAARSVQGFRQSVLAAACAGRLTADWRKAHPKAHSVEGALSLLRKSRKAPGVSKEQAVDLAVPDLPETYIVAALGDCADMIEYGTSKRCDASSDRGVAVLRMGNIQDGALDVSDLKYCPSDAEIKRLLLRDGDLLFNRTNSPELVGKSAVFHGSTLMSFASYLIRVRFAKDIANPDFVNYWISSAWGRQWARLAKTDGVSQSNINGTRLSLMAVPLPPIEEQREIVDRASRMLALADGLDRRISAASASVGRSSQAALNKALRGELGVRGAGARKDV